MPRGAWEYIAYSIGNNKDMTPLWTSFLNDSVFERIKGNAKSKNGFIQLPRNMNLREVLELSDLKYVQI